VTSSLVTSDWRIDCEPNTPLQRHIGSGERRPESLNIFLVSEPYNRNSRIGFLKGRWGGGGLAAVLEGGSFLSAAGDSTRLERSIQISSEAKCELIARGPCLLCVS